MPQKTKNNNAAERITSSGDLVVITPSDSVTFEHFTKAIILLNGDGTLSAVDAEGKTVAVTAGLQTGVQYAFQLQKINNTGTGATSILAMF